MKKCKYFLLIAAALFVYACNSSPGNPSRVDLDAETYSYAAYKGKTVQSINYCDGCSHSGDLLILNFTDGTHLKVYAYKYNMKIEQ